MKNILEFCPDCKGLFEPTDGTIHDYLGGSAGCWKAYGELLAREYNDANYMKFHRWTVDAYAAQHPGKQEPRASQSVHVHLVALYLLIEQNMEPSEVTEVIGKVIKKYKGRFVWMEPPKSFGSMTVLDVLQAETSENHGELVMKWSKSVWMAWSEWHDHIRSLSAEFV